MVEQKKKIILELKRNTKEISQNFKYQRNSVFINGKPE